MTQNQAGPQGLAPREREVGLARRKSMASATEAFDLQDLTGLHNLDRFAGNQPNAPQAARTAYTPGAWSSAPRHTSSTPRSFDQPRSSQNWSAPSRAGLGPPRGASRSGGRGGMNRGRGRGRGPTMGNRGRGMLFDKHDEPSLPPPPPTILNTDGQYGPELLPSGTPHATAGLSAGGLQEIKQQKKAKKVESSLLSSDYRTIAHALLSKESSPIHLPGFEKPIMSSLAGVTKEVQARSFAIEPSEMKAGGTMIVKKEEVIGRALNLVSQNASMNLEQKQQAVGVVDFLLLSREQRLERMVNWEDANWVSQHLKGIFFDFGISVLVGRRCH